MEYREMERVASAHYHARCDSARATLSGNPDAFAEETLAALAEYRDTLNRWGMNKVRADYAAIQKADVAAWGAPKWMETAVSARIVAE